jgi:hypothetical protein
VIYIPIATPAIAPELRPALCVAAAAAALVVAAGALVAEVVGVADVLEDELELDAPSGFDSSGQFCQSGQLISAM